MSTRGLGKFGARSANAAASRADRPRRAPMSVAVMKVLIVDMIISHRLWEWGLLRLVHRK